MSGDGAGSGGGEEADTVSVPGLGEVDAKLFFGVACLLAVAVAAACGCALSKKGCCACGCLRQDDSRTAENRVTPIGQKNLNALASRRPKFVARGTAAGVPQARGADPHLSVLPAGVGTGTSSAGTRSGTGTGAPAMSMASMRNNASGNNDVLAAWGSGEEKAGRRKTSKRKRRKQKEAQVKPMAAGDTEAETPPPLFVTLQLPDAAAAAAAAADTQEIV